jgi:hypothetical protein
MNLSGTCCKEKILCPSSSKINHMKTVKTLAAALLLTGILSTGAFAQKETKKDALKEHVCTKACTKTKHAYAHGEKGHVCGDACKKMMMDKKGKM